MSAMSKPTAIAAAAIRYVAGETGGELPFELRGLPEDQLQQVLKAAARAVAAASITAPYQPQHARQQSE